MKNMFPGFYRPTEEEFETLWDHCIFVLDTNVLLNLYRYSTETCNELIDILNKISDRLWIPHQVAFEFHKHRLSVISSQKEAYSNLENLLNNYKNKIENDLKTYLKHPIIKIKPYLDKTSNLFKKVIADIKKQEKNHPNLIANDSIRNHITTLFGGNVGEKYSDERLNQIYELGKKRYEKKIPPGYEDEKEKSKDEEKYGDLVLWFQILDKAKEIHKPIILISDDEKEDWWWHHKGQTVGPRPELVDEILSNSKVSFYMYKSDQFMEYSRKYLKREVDQKAIDEIREIRISTEIWKKAIDKITALTNDIKDVNVALFLENLEFKKDNKIATSYDRVDLMIKKESLKNELTDICKKMESLSEAAKKCKDLSEIHNIFANAAYLQKEYFRIYDEIEKIDNKLKEVNIWESWVKSKEPS
jgi:predicted nucleic acid-binding protein